MLRHPSYTKNIIFQIVKHLVAAQYRLNWHEISIHSVKLRYLGLYSYILLFLFHFSWADKREYAAVFKFIDFGSFFLVCSWTRGSTGKILNILLGCYSIVFIRFDFRIPSKYIYSEINKNFRYKIIPHSNECIKLNNSFFSIHYCQSSLLQRNISERMVGKKVFHLYHICFSMVDVFSGIARYHRILKGYEDFDIWTKI